MDPLLFGSVAFRPMAEEPPPPRSSDARSLEFELEGPAHVGVGEVVALRLRVRNLDTQGATLLRPLDGSVERLRSPHYEVYLREEVGDVTYRWEIDGRRCGNVNPIQPNDYVDLEPGGSIDDLLEGWGAMLSTVLIGRPGTYRLWFVYRDCGSRDAGIPLGQHYIRPTRVGEFVSNAVTVEVR